MESKYIAELTDEGHTAYIAPHPPRKLGTFSSVGRVDLGAPLGRP